MIALCVAFTVHSCAINCTVVILVTHHTCTVHVCNMHGTCPESMHIVWTIPVGVYGYMYVICMLLHVCMCVCMFICIDALCIIMLHMCLCRLQEVHKSLETIRKQITDKLSEVETARRDLVEIEHKEGRQE